MVTNTLQVDSVYLVLISCWDTKRAHRDMTPEKNTHKTMLRLGSSRTECKCLIYCGEECLLVYVFCKFCYIVVLYLSYPLKLVIVIVLQMFECRNKRLSQPFTHLTITSAKQTMCEKRTSLSADCNVQSHLLSCCVFSTSMWCSWCVRLQGWL